MTSNQKYNVVASDVPGCPPVSYPVATMAEARELAKSYSHRRDLRYMDVRIESADGQLVEYAGPAR
jgi:hypothetical protein